MTRFCSEVGCNEIHFCKGLCSVHFSRKRRLDAGAKPHPDMIGWLRAHASVDDKENCIQWPFFRMKSGICGTVRFNGKRQLATRIMCELVNGPAPSDIHEAAHECGKGHEGCINPHHLSWKTPTENQHDKIKHGTTNRGERSAMAKLTVKKVIAIREVGEVDSKILAALFSVSRQTINGVVSRRRWRHVA